MINQTFYNSQIKKHILIFGSLFKDIYINRVDVTNKAIQGMQVPLRYGPKEKFLARMIADPTLDRPAVTLPIMGYECTGLVYSPDRKLNTMNRQISQTLDTGKALFVYSPVPYDFQFKLTAMVKNIDDGQQIVEQIVPFFTPDFTVKTKLLDQIPVWQEIPIILQGITPTDTYQGNFTERRAILWDLTFIMRGYIYGPVRNQPIIRTAIVDFTSFANNLIETMTVTPGLTANGQPTSDSSQTININDINPTDNYGFIIDINESVQP